MKITPVNISCDWCMQMKGFPGFFEKRGEAFYHTHEGTWLPERLKITYETTEYA